MKRHQDIKELLEEVKETISFFDKQVDTAKTDEAVLKISSPKLKSTMEHLRSILEYCAHDIAETALGLDTNDRDIKRKLYFPYGKDEQSFKSMLGRIFKGLSGEYLQVVESIQPHKCGEDWLIKLCELTNFIKHNSFQNQDRENQGESETKVAGNGQVPGIARVSGDGRVTIGKLSVGGRLMNPGGKLEISNKRAVKDISNDLQNLFKVERSHEHVVFKDSESGTDLIVLIKTSYQGISRFVDELYSLH
ncbi:hypothetical protein [Vibrio diabolicus]|uniref:hypothetical protein n=1 Tax=Vibrio diabolicus TaxID=50719 RepID=UPI00211AEB25|nr:hypothetical protein [Vibrio diabolicus]MCG6219273.1 hypothetical protein [Vibrio diabolicus]